MESLEGDSEIKSQSETNNKVKKIIKRTVTIKKKILKSSYKSLLSTGTKEKDQDQNEDDSFRQRFNTEGNVYLDENQSQNENDNNVSDVGYFEDNLKTDDSEFTGNENYSSRTLPTPRRFPSILKINNNMAKVAEAEIEEKYLIDRKLSNVELESNDFEEKLKCIKLSLSNNDQDKREDKEILQVIEKKANKLDSIFNVSRTKRTLIQSDSRKNSSLNNENIYQIEEIKIIHEEILRERENEKETEEKNIKKEKIQKINEKIKENIMIEKISKKTIEEKNLHINEDIKDYEESNINVADNQPIKNFVIKTEDDKLNTETDINNNHTNNNVKELKIQIEAPPHLLDNTNAGSPHSKEEDIILNDHVEVSKEDLEEEDGTNIIDFKENSIKKSNIIDSNEEDRINENRLSHDKIINEEVIMISNLKPEIVENPFTHMKESKNMVKPLEASIINNEIISELASKINLTYNDDKKILETPEKQIEEINGDEKPNSNLNFKLEDKKLSSTAEIDKTSEPIAINKDEIIAAESCKVLCPEPSHIKLECPQKSARKNNLDESFYQKVEAKKGNKSFLTRYSGIISYVLGGLAMSYFIYRRFKS